MVIPLPTPSLEQIHAAHSRISPQIVRTPTRHSTTLSALHGAELWFKFEQLQFTASFKERGALNKLLSLSPEERERGVVAASAGNHAQAVAYHARRLGIAATIVMPRTTPFIKVTNTEILGATVVLHGMSVDAARTRAQELAETQHLVPVPPFDDPFIICGQGTLGIELVEDAAALDVVVVPVGGGGLIAGTALAVKALSPNTRVIGVQTERFCAMTHLLRAHHAGVPYDRTQLSHPSLGPFSADTLADGIAVKTPGELTRHFIAELVDDMVLVSEASIEQAVNELLEYEKAVVEGAGAAALAAVIQHGSEFSGQRVGCVVSGGNIDPRALADTVARGLVRTGRLARLRIDVRDLPGSLAELTRIIADAGANVVDVVHERVFLASPLQRTRLSIELATRHHAHIRDVAERLRAAGHDVEVSSQ